MTAPLYIQWSFAVRTNNGSLRNWKRLNNRVVCSCPFCGDSATDKNKARGNIHEYKSTLVYHCYNCGESMSFENFLKQTNEPLYKEYKIQVLSNNGNSSKSVFQAVETKVEKTAKTRKSVVQWQDAFTKPSGDALKYLQNRNVPIDNILYAKDFKQSIMDLYDLYGLEFDISSKFPKKSESRIIFPFVYDDDLTYVQGRSIDPTIPKSYRYMTQEIVGGHKVFGFDRLNKEGKVYVTEGPIDSLFVSNGIAVADANLTRAVQVVTRDRLVLVFDNEPRSNIAVGKMEGALRTGFSIVIFPDYVGEKDLNDMKLAGRNVQELVESYTYSGPAGLMRLNAWKRV